MAVRKRELSIGVAILLIATSAYILGWTNLFTVRNIEVMGAPNSQITNSILKISEVRTGQKMARVEPRNIESRLKLSGIGWLESVDISRNWFTGKLTLKLMARTAVAKSGSQYVDITGTLFSTPNQMPQELQSKLPELKAIDTKSRANGVAAYLQLPEPLRSEITVIGATSQENYQFTVGKDLRVIWGDGRDTEVKVKIFNALRALPENKKITMMDLSDPTKPSVK